MENYEFCIIKENDFIEYEKKMYEAYMKKTPEINLFQDLEIVDNCRLRPKIPYNKLITYAGKYQGEIFAGVKINIDKDNFFFKKMGFSIPKEDHNKIVCEGINYFIIDNNYDQNLTFNLAEKFSLDFLKDVKSRGFQIKYGVCLKRIKIIYIRMGYEFIDQKEIDNLTNCFIKFDFEKNKIKEV